MGADLPRKMVGFRMAFDGSANGVEAAGPCIAVLVRRASGRMRLASFGLICALAALLMSACDDDRPTGSPTPVSEADTPTATSAAPTSVPMSGPVPASNIPLPTPPPSPVPDPTPTPGPAVSIIELAREKMDAAGSLAFEIGFNMEVLKDGRTHHIPVTWIGDARTDGYSSADVVVTVPDGTAESRVIILDSTVHVLDASTSSWDSHYSESPYFIDLAALFGSCSGDVTDLALTGQKVVDGVDTHRVEGRLRGLEIAGARGDFDVVCWIGAADGLVREVFAFGRLEVDDETTLIGNLSAETASIKLTARLFDHGKRVDIVTPTLAIPRFGHEAVLLDDGRVLVGGGFTGIANNNVIVPFPLGLVQVYEPAAGLWSIIEPLLGPGILYSAVKLADGRVLFVGLHSGDDQTVGMAIVFNPVAESWTPLPGSTSPRGVPSLVLLDDGRVLVAGGLDFSGATSPFSSPEAVNVVEILDPHTGDWQQAASMNRTSEEQWLFSLNDGRVLAIGAVRDGSSEPTAHAEVYDPATDTWTLIASLEPYYVPSNAIELSDGRLLVLGTLSEYESVVSQGEKMVQIELPDGRKLNAQEIAQQFPGAKIYDPASDTWTPGGDMALARPAATLVLLPDGRVLAAGGEYGWGEGFPSYSTTEIFDPGTLSWSVGPDLSELRGSSSVTLLSNGRLLLAGGIGMVLDIEEVYPLVSSEIVDPSSPGTGAPAVTSTQSPASGTPASVCEPPVGHAPIAVLKPEATPPAPQTVLSATNEAMETVASYHLESVLRMTLGAGDSEETTSIRLVIDVQAPDRVRGCISQSDPLGGFEIEFAEIGDVVYTGNPQSGEWEVGESPESEPTVDLLDFVGDDIVVSVEEPSVDGLGILNDVKVQRVTGIVAAAALGDTTLLRDFDIGGGELDVVYWVGVDDSLVRRFIAKGMVELDWGEMVDLFMSVEVSDFGGVLVEAPETGRK